MTEQRDTLVQAIFENTQTIKRGMFMRLHEAAEQLPVTRSQLELLFTLRHHQTISAKELAKQMQLTPGAISQLVDQLLRKQFISRVPAPDDRRIQLLQMTDDAVSMLQRLEQQRQQAMARVMQSLTTDELKLWLQVQRKLMAEFAQPTTGKEV